MGHANVLIFTEKKNNVIANQGEGSSLCMSISSENVDV